MKEPHFLMPVSIGLAVAGFLLAWIIYQKEIVRHESLRETFKPVYRLLLKKYWLDDFYYLLYRYALIGGVSYACGWFDRYIVDGVVNLVSWSTRKSAELIRSIQDGKVQDYLYGVLIGLVILMLLGVF